MKSNEGNGDLCRLHGRRGLSMKPSTFFLFCKRCFTNSHRKCLPSDFLSPRIYCRLLASQMVLLKLETLRYIHEKFWRDLFPWQILCLQWSRNLAIDWLLASSCLPALLRLSILLRTFACSCMLSNMQRNVQKQCKDTVMHQVVGRCNYEVYFSLMQQLIYCSSTAVIIVSSICQC